MGSLESPAAAKIAGVKISNSTTVNIRIFFKLPLLNYMIDSLKIFYIIKTNYSTKIDFNTVAQFANGKKQIIEFSRL